MGTLILRPYQQAALSAVYRAWSSGKSSNPLIVAPCGAGKSIIIAELIRDALQSWPGTRILMLTHRKELLRQNGEELRRLWPEAPIGYYSAGLGRRDRQEPILFAGIQSIAAHITEFDPFDLVVIDEAHLVPRSTATRYGETLRNLRLMDPSVKILGLTATPYRLDSGRLDRGPEALFDSIAYDIPVQTLIDAGHLVPMVARGGRAKADLHGVHLRGGEFVPAEMAAAFDQSALVRGACAEIVAAGADRKAWLVFCAGVDHAANVRDELRRLGVEAELVTGETPAAERDAITGRFRDGKLRCLCNVDVLTTGANFPRADLLALLRATASTGLYVQIVGRGMRTHEGKEDCLLLDFGGNVVRHGPIDDVDPKAPGKGGPAPAKECPRCMAIVPAGCTTCPDCGHEWERAERELSHETRAYEGAVLKAQVPEWRPVRAVSYHRHQKAGRPDSVRVIYEIGVLSVTDWWCPEHGGYASEKSWHALRQAGWAGPRPETVTALLDGSGLLRTPTEIRVQKDGKYHRVAGVRYGA